MKKQYTRKQISEAISHWKKVLEDMDNASEDAPEEVSGEETIKIPSTPSEEEDFIKWADDKLDGSAYDKIVSDKPEEVEGAQRDLDDFDLYKYSLQDALDEDDFWEKILEGVHEDFDDGEVVQASRVISWLERKGKSIADDAFENFDPGEEYCVHVGYYKPESYWRG